MSTTVSKFAARLKTSKPSKHFERFARVFAAFGYRLTSGIDLANMTHGKPSLVCCLR